MTRVETLLPDVLASLLPEGVANRRVNWLEVARKDVNDAARNWQLYVLYGLFSAALLLATATDLADPQVGGADLTFVLGLESVVWTTRWLVLAVGLLVGYTAVVGERGTGSLRVLLGLPITRRDVLVGKLLGRSVVVGVTLSVGLATAGGVLWGFYAGVDLVGYAVFVALTLVYGFVFVAAGVGISAAVESHARATGAVAGVFALTTFLWNRFVGLVPVLHDGALRTSGEAEPWLVFLANASPAVGYGSLVEEWVAVGWPGPYAGTGAVFEGEDQLVTGADPFYLQPEVVLLVLFLWGVVPVLVGAWRFGRTDLG